MKFSSSSLPLGQGFVNKRVRAILRHNASDTLKTNYSGRRFASYNDRVAYSIDTRCLPQRSDRLRTSPTTANWS